MDNVVLVLDWNLIGFYLRNLSNSTLFVTLIVLMLVDVLTGKYKAISKGVLDSSIGTSGIIKHTTILLLTVVVYVTSRIIGMVEISYIFKVFYILEYITSILENLEVLGIPFPDSFTRYFNRMRKENNEKEL